MVEQFKHFLPTYPAIALPAITIIDLNGYIGLVAGVLGVIYTSIKIVQSLKKKDK